MQNYEHYVAIRLDPEMRLSSKGSYVNVNFTYRYKFRFFYDNIMQNRAEIGMRGGRGGVG